MEEISHLGQERDPLARLVVADTAGRPDPKRVCRRENCEMHEFLEARQKDLHTARVSGQQLSQTHDASFERVAAPTDGVVAIHPMRTW